MQDGLIKIIVFKQSNYLFYFISLFRFVFYFFPSIFFISVFFVLLSLVSFHFVSISFRFVSFRFRWFRFVSFLFRFALYRYPKNNHKLILFSTVWYLIYSVSFVLEIIKIWFTLSLIILDHKIILQCIFSFFQCKGS